MNAFENFWVEQAPLLHLLLKVPIGLLLFLDYPLDSFGWLTSSVLSYSVLFMIKVALEKRLGWGSSKRVYLTRLLLLLL